MAEVSVQIGANIRDLEKKLGKAEKGLKDLEKVSSKSGAKISKIGATASKGVNKLQKSTANATPAVQEFSRVIQDAPFGIQGVANNITQLTSQFGYLQKSAGGTKAALKAMLGTLTGPAGILLAVSAVTSLLVSYGDEIFALIGKTDKLSDATKEFTGEAKAEVTQLNALVSIAQDETKSKGQREIAISKLNKKYKNYLGNLSLETINSDNAKKSVDALTTSLIRQAQIRGISKLIEEKSLELAEDEIEAKKDGLKESKKIIASNAATSKSYDEQRIAFLTYGKDYKKTQDSIRKEGGKKIASTYVKKETEEIQSEINELSNFLTEKLGEQFKLDDIFGSNDGGKGGSDKRPKIPLLNIETPEEAKAKFQSYGKEVLSAIQGDTKTKIGTGLIDVSGANNEIQKFIDGFNPLTDKFQELPQQAKIMSDAISSSFYALSSQISSSLETGNAVVDAFTQSLISSFAQIAAAGIQSLVTEKVIAVGKNQINRSVSSGNAVTAATSAAAALGPLGAVALPGLIASQLAIVNGAFAGIQAFAKGGFSGDNNLAYLNKNELVLRPFEQAALLNAFRGTGMSKLTSNTKSESDYGIVGQVVLRGQNQVVQLKRANKKMKRYFN